MSAWSKVLSPDERAEVEGLVVAAFVDMETGETRSTRDAKTEFLASFESARMAGRVWADAMADEWTANGAGTFAANLWKRRDTFTTTVKGVQRTRSLHRGKKARRDDGSSVDVQASLLDWSVDDLKEAIVAEVMRAQEADVNVGTYRKLIRLCQESGVEPVEAALLAIGMSLDEYLASEDAA